MQKIISRSLIYALLIIIVVPSVYYIHERTTTVSPFGSVLSTYFYTIYSKQHADTIYDADSLNAKVNDKQLRDFYTKLNWRKKDSKISYDSLDDSTWQQYTPDGAKKKNYLLYWQTLRPEIRRFYQENIKHVSVPYPVIHLRCSDAPFVRHPQYHLTKGKTAKWMADQIKNRGYNKIIFLSCNKHMKIVNNTCDEFVDFYTTIFENSGLSVETQCDTIYNDFATMVYSPLLVSLNASSYSFMAGISKDPQNYISCNLGRERQGQYLLQTEGDWIWAHDAPLLHKDVPDYHDAKDVLKKLES